MRIQGSTVTRAIHLFWRGRHSTNTLDHMKADPKLVRAVTESMRRHCTLEELAARHSLEQVCLDVGVRLQKVVRGEARFRDYPPFCLLHFIEACAFSSRLVGRLPVPEQVYRMVQDQVIAASDPIDRYLIEQSLGLWLRRVERQQFLVQSLRHPISMGRCIRLLGENSPLSSISELLEAKYGFSIGDWLCVHAILWTMTRDAPNPSLLHNWVDAVPESAISQQSLSRCLEHLCHSRQSLADHYKAQRPWNRLAGWTNPLSAFLARPCIRFEEGISTPVPSLLVHHGIYGLRELLRSVDSPNVACAFSAALENYAVDLVAATNVAAKYLSGRHLRQELAGSRTCDGLWEFDDCILLLECKSFVSQQRTLQPDPLRKSTETSELVHGMTQIRETATAIRRRRLPQVASDKPIVGIIVTVQECGGVNIPSYFQSIIEPVLEEEQSDDSRFGAQFVAHPIAVFSLDALDFLAIWMSTHKRGPLGVFDSYATQQQMMKGAWDRYLMGLVGDLPNPLAEFWHRPFELLVHERFDIPAHNDRL